MEAVKDPKEIQRGKVRDGYISTSAYGLFFGVFIACCVIGQTLLAMGDMPEARAQKIIPYLVGGVGSSIIGSRLACAGGNSSHGRRAALYTSLLFTLSICFVGALRHYPGSTIPFKTTSSFVTVVWLIVVWFIVFAVTSAYTWLFNCIYGEIRPSEVRAARR